MLEQQEAVKFLTENAFTTPAQIPEGFVMPRVNTSGDDWPMYRAELRARLYRPGW